MEQSERRYDIDALRVLAFGLLILYHIGMYYVADWDWHIKSDRTSVALQDGMILSNLWRMSLLFFISGMALALVQHKYRPGQLLALRARRLLVPLLLGMVVICAPQMYWQLVWQQGYDQSFWAFWPQYLNPGTSLYPNQQSAIGLLTWNHLWYLPYLFCYSLVLLALARPLRWLAARPLAQKLGLWPALMLACAALMGIWFWLRADFPSTHALLDDWYNHGKYLLVMVLGYFFVCQRRLWDVTIAKRWWLLMLALLAYGVIIAERHGAFAGVDGDALRVRLVWGAVLSLNHWCWLLAVLGFGGRWLNRPWPWLNYANEAVLPWYMLHQTLIILAAAYLHGLALPLWLEVPALLGLTLAGCALGFEIVRRVALLRWLFGLKAKAAATPRPLPARQNSY